MLDFLWLIPLLPLASATLLMVTAGSLPRSLVAICGAGSVGLAALCVLATGLSWAENPVPRQVELWTWMQVGEFRPTIGLYLDGLTLVMMSVITGVGFLIHLYSTEFMQEDESLSRYFAYMNLFVAAMLILVMADNLLLLYLGWEGVGLCSYLLVGFWYRDPANGAAARKAFVVHRTAPSPVSAFHPGRCRGHRSFRPNCGRVGTDRHSSRTQHLPDYGRNRPGHARRHQTVREVPRWCLSRKHSAYGSTSQPLLCLG